MILKKNLEQMYQILNKIFERDFEKFDYGGFSNANDIRLNCFGEIGDSIKSIEFELKKIETASSLAIDMEKGLVVKKGDNVNGNGQEI